MDLTPDQLTALEFYQNNEQFVNYNGLFNLEREERILYKKGKALLQSALDAKAKGERNRYTDEEEWVIATDIVEGKTKDQIVANFMSQFNTHSAHSIELQVRQAVNQATNGAQGMAHKTQSLMAKLHQLNPAMYW